MQDIYWLSGNRLTFWGIFSEQIDPIEVLSKNPFSVKYGM